ncbi:MAG: MATE family efflux transporter, partial [Cetobacterium sp.]
IGSFVGQNYGAKLHSRIKDGYKTGIDISTVIGVLTTLIFIIFPEVLVQIFVKKIETVEIAVNYMRIIGLSQLFMCYEIMTNGAFSGIGKPKIPSTISIIFTSLRIPMAFILSKEEYFGLNGVWISIALSSVIKGIISPLTFKKYLNNGVKKDEFNKRAN